MKPLRKTPRLLLRRASSRLGPLLMLFQRSPVVQWLFPEVKVLGTAGIGEITKWTAATIAGLGAYDTVSGASQITQTAPQPGSTTVDTAVGASLSFVYQVTGTLTESAGSWQLSGDLPAGLAQTTLSNMQYNAIVGKPEQEGDFPVMVTAWKDPNFTGASISQVFTITVGPPVITSHPASVTITSGGTTTLTVAATGPGLTYQWYKGTVPNTTNLISGATAASYTTPALTATSTYMVRVTKGTIVSYSDPATVTIGTPDPFQDWRAARFTPAQLADLAISGPTADPDGDTFTNAAEYAFGSDPLTREPSPLALTVSGANVILSLTARAATGTGYAGKTRHYAIESRTDLVNGTWSSPAGYADITGSGQTVIYTEAKGTVPKFYRLRVWLTP